MRNHQGYPQGFQQRTQVQRALLISLPTLLTHRCSSASPLLHCSSSGSVCQIDYRRPETPRPAAFAAGVLRLDTCGLRRPSSARGRAGARSRADLRFDVERACLWVCCRESCWPALVLPAGQTRRQGAGTPRVVARVLRRRSRRRGGSGSARTHRPSLAGL